MIRSTSLRGLLGIGTLLLALAGCTQGPEAGPAQETTTRELVLAQGPDATSQALGHAYRDLLADAGINARLGEAAADPVAEVLAGRADMAVAGSSMLLAALAALPGTTGTKDAEGSAAAGSGTEAAAPRLDAAGTKAALHALKARDFAVLDSADAERTGTLVVTAATSAGEQLVNISQLAALCPQLDFGVVRDERARLLDELSAALSCHPKSVIELSAQQADGVLPVITDAVQVQATTLANAGIPDNALVVLQDSATLFAPESLTPVVTKDGVGQDAVAAINKLSAALKQEDLLDLNRMVSGRDALAPQKAAADWLADKSLLGGR